MNAANADKRDVAFKKHQQILFAVSNSNGASTAGSLHPDVSFNYELMAVGDIDGDDDPEIVVADFDGKLFAIKDTTAHHCVIKGYELEGDIMVLDVFPFVDENQAEIIVMDSVGLLSVLSCDLLNKDDAVILRKIIAQDVDISNATAMKACKTFDKTMSMLIISNCVSISFFMFDPIDLKLTCVRQMQDICNISSLDTIHPDYLVCGSSVGSLHVIQWSLQPVGSTDIANSSADVLNTLTQPQISVPATAASDHTFSNPSSRRPSLATAVGSNTPVNSSPPSRKQSLASMVKMTVKTNIVAYDSTQSVFNVPSGAAYVISLSKGEAAVWHAFSSAARMSTGSLDASGSVSPFNAVGAKPLLLHSSSSGDIARITSQSSIPSDLSASGSFTDPFMQGFFAACWRDGTISVCRVTKSLNRTAQEISADAESSVSISWQVVYTTQTADILYKLGKFPENLFQAPQERNTSVMPSPSLLPRGTLVATSISGQCYLICLSQIWTQCGRLVENYGAIQSYQLGSIDKLSLNMMSETTPAGDSNNPIATVFRFDFKLFTGLTGSRNFCCLINQTGDRVISSQKSDKHYETIVTSAMDWRIYYISAMNEISFVSGIDEHIRSLGPAELIIS